MFCRKNIFILYILYTILKIKPTPSFASVNGPAGWLETATPIALCGPRACVTDANQQIPLVSGFLMLDLEISVYFVKNHSKIRTSFCRCHRLPRPARCRMCPVRHDSKCTAAGFRPVLCRQSLKNNNGHDTENNNHDLLDRHRINIPLVWRQRLF